MLGTGTVTASTPLNTPGGQPGHRLVEVRSASDHEESVRSSISHSSTGHPRPASQYRTVRAGGPPATPPSRHGPATRRADRHAYLTVARAGDGHTVTRWRDGLGHALLGDWRRRLMRRPARTRGTKLALERASCGVDAALEGAGLITPDALSRDSSYLPRCRTPASVGPAPSFVDDLNRRPDEPA